MDKKDYTISYPELSEEGKKNTQKIIDKFAKQLEELFNTTLYSFTCNLGEEIVDDDSWINLRQETLAALCDYSSSTRIKKQAGKFDGQWWVIIRKKILDENREAIISDIILDKEYKIKQLEEQIQRLQEDARKHY